MCLCVHALTTSGLGHTAIAPEVLTVTVFVYGNLIDILDVIL